MLCFVEVRTRTSRDFKPAKAAVDHDKRRQLIMVARNFLRPMSVPPRSRFDVLAVYYEHSNSLPSFGAVSKCVFSVVQSKLREPH